MGLLDLPLIAEMDELEQSAANGNEQAFITVMDMLPTQKRLYIDRMMKRNGYSARESFERAGIIASHKKSYKPVT